MTRKHSARYLGLLFSTSECGVAARSADGVEAYASVPMAGRTQWQGWPAHHLERCPQMLADALGQLAAQGWDFSTPGFISQAWRQHDLAVLGDDAAPLIPAPSWECNAATRETELLRLRVPQLIAAVGPIEPRFVVAKLPWAVQAQPDLAPAIRQTMLSGDWVNGMLTGNWRLGCSDALSNGLLHQRSKAIAAEELRAAGKVLQGRLRPEWFPAVISTAGVLGAVQPAEHPAWSGITKLLSGWQAVAPLGDNQATAAGCGAADYGTVVLSLGTSGTVNRVCPAGAVLRGAALTFDYWDDRLLLTMLPQCGSWYENFRSVYEPERSHAELNELAAAADVARLRYVGPPLNASWRWPELEDLKPAERVASIQVSIAIELLERVRLLLAEIKGPSTPVTRFVLTGGLVRMPLLRDALSAGLRRLTGSAQVLINDRSGPLAYKSDALGALCNAMIAESGTAPVAVIASQSRLKPCPPSGGFTLDSLENLPSHVA